MEVSCGCGLVLSWMLRGFPGLPYPVTVWSQTRRSPSCFSDPIDHIFRVRFRHLIRNHVHIDCGSDACVSTKTKMAHPSAGAAPFHLEETTAGGPHRSLEQTTTDGPHSSLREQNTTVQFGNLFKIAQCVMMRSPKAIRMRHRRQICRL